MGTFAVPIPKGGGATLEIDTDAIPPEAYHAVVMAGLEALLGKRMSKITGLTKLEGEDLAKAHEAAAKIAQENLDNLMANKVPTKGARAAKTPGITREVRTEAMRLVKAVLKDQVRANGQKPSMVPAKQYTEAANLILADDPKYFEQAKINLEARAQIPKPTLDLSSMLQESPTLLAKAKAKSDANKAEGLSKTQAGKVKPRGRKTGMVNTDGTPVTT